MNSIPCWLQNPAYATNIAVTTATKSFTYRELDALINGTKKFLQSRHVAEGDRIALQLPNSIEYIIALFALWRIRAVPCLLNMRLTDTEREKQAKFLNYKDLITDIKLLAHTHADDFEGYHLHQEASVIFTSGSTGGPKAVLHTFGNHYYSALGSNANIPVTQGDFWHLALPLYHVGGLSILFRTFMSGGAVSLNEKYATHVSLVPTQLIRLVKNKNLIDMLQEKKAILLGGAPVPEGLKRQIELLQLPVYYTYGMTEMSSQVATSPSPRAGAQILEYRELKITHDHEILVKGETLFKKYVNRKNVREDGWYRTGDLGKMDPAGLHVFGRKDRMFISGGENIYPEEIESALLSIEGIEEVRVEPKQDKEFGMRPVAYVRGNGIAESVIKKNLESRLAKFKMPVRIQRIS